jgi:hypothetical protein
MRVAVVGFGRLGRTCAEVLALDDHFVPAGFIRRQQTVAAPRPPRFSALPAVTHVSELGTVDAALVCVPLAQVREVSREQQRYLYVELDEDAEFGRVEAALRSDPLFLGEETLVFRVDDVSALEDEGQGVLLKRYGTAARTAHQMLLFEARVSELALSAQCMAAAAHALPGLKASAYSLFDLPPGALWGRLRAEAERQWL